MKAWILAFTLVLVALGAQAQTDAVAVRGTASPAFGVTPIVAASKVNNLVVKASPGNLYQIYAANQTATGGFLIVLNATSAPADGAVLPLACAKLAASGDASLNFAPGPPMAFSTGIVAVVSSGADCFTKTTGTVTAFFEALAQ